MASKHRSEILVIRSQQEEHQRTVMTLTTRHIEDLKSQHAGQIESMRREIDRLVSSLTEVTKDRDRLLRRLIQDEKKE